MNYIEQALTANIVLAIGGANSFVSMEVQNSTFVPRINIGAKDPAKSHQITNRWR